MLRNFFNSIILLVVFGWGMVSLYDTQMQFAEIVKDPEPPWELTFNLIPVAIAILVGVVISAQMYNRERDKGTSLKKIWLKIIFLPQEFEEGDEREVIITAKATRAAYISMWIAAPIITALLLIYPFVSGKVPYFPIIIFLLLPLVQAITYTVSWRKHYNN